MTDITTIILENVSKSYPTTPSIRAVRDINLNIKQGEFFCLVGPSGCGKSTLLKIISGIEKPSLGLVTSPKNIAMVFQSGALLPWLNVFDNVAFGLKMENTSKAVMAGSVFKNLQLVNLTSFEKKYPRELSGGQRQRVGIARALAINPEVLLLDEPFSALDPITTKELHKDLLKIWQETKTTIVMVSHSLEEAIELADRIAVMSEGQIRGIMEVSMRRPRQIKSPEFIKEEEKITQLLSR